MNLLEVKNICKTYGSGETAVKALKDVSFSVPKGEYVAVVGESGSGKTQTALSILQLLKENSAVSGGEILYEDSSVAHASSQDLQRIRGKEISMIFQEPMTSLNPVLTIEEQIAEGLLIHESCTPTERHEKVLAIMHEVELPDPEKLCKKYPHQLSGGQRQRISLARAILKDAPIVVLDEATAYADPENEEKMEAAIAELVKGKTLVVIAHKLPAIMNADQICVMDHGKLVATGRHQELIQSCPEYQKLWKAAQDSAEWKVHTAKEGK